MGKCTNSTVILHSQEEQIDVIRNQQVGGSNPYSGLSYIIVDFFGRLDDVIFVVVQVFTFL